ncbi:extracellular solute-binding protein [Streptomyces millisiae]|uniref:Extracellular solute-binding protein n=1 Tax=Streptomyces millisiae TaxID=3075542 RepID=A0ABU2LNB8_9ACTN|nr:extracellular solute-binding protein [Streptomyces sp. DSM 44918]MDT0319010.1 extracellular solute-binding protein [Streptomyces sp. DSM 44918]
MTRSISRREAALGFLALAGTLAVGCGGPGGSGPRRSDTGPSPSAAPTIGTEPVTLKAYFETGFPMARALTDEFTRQFPNVTWDIREDQFAVITQNAPRVLADDPPDLMRLPQVSELVGDGLLLNLDGYAEVFGWDGWPPSQLEQLRVAPEGRPRGEGSLYAMGLNFSMTGVFYNRTLAERIGMASPPATLAEFDELLASAKDAGIVPIVQFNGGATGGFAFPLQNLMAAYGQPGPINDWIFQKPDVTIDTPSNLSAVRHLQEWIEAGYFDPDANAMEYAQMMSTFMAGDALLMFNGDWESGNLDGEMPGEVGFFLMPPAEAGGPVATMSAPLTYGISANAAHPDEAAFFLDWAATDERAREIVVEVGGSHPMGPPDAHMPEVAEDSVTGQTLAAGARIAEDDGAMDFIANATGSVYAKGWTPQLQRLFAGDQNPEGLLAAVQREYEIEAGS